MHVPTLLEINLAYAKGPKAVTEASLARVMGQVGQVGGGQGSFGMVTTWRHVDKTRQQNEADFQSLKQTAQSLRLGYRQMLGHWQVCQDPNINWQQCPKEQMIDSAEPTLFISGVTEKQMNMLGTRWPPGQDAWIYAGPETGGKVYLYYEGGSDYLGDWRPGVLEQGYSQMYRRKKNTVFRNLETGAGSSGPAFSFTTKKTSMPTEESCHFQFIEVVPTSFMEGLLFSKYSYLRDAMLQNLTENRNARSR